MEFADLPKVVVIELALVAFLAGSTIHAVRSVNERGGRWAKSEISLLEMRPFCLGLFSAWALILAFVHDMGWAGTSLALHWCIAFGWYLVFRHLFGDPHYLPFFTRVLSMAAIVVSFLGILQYYFGVDWITQVAPPASTFGNRNHAVHFIAPLCVFIFGLTYFEGRKGDRIFYQLALTLLLVFGYATGSRAFVLAIGSAFAAGAVIFFVRAERGCWPATAKQVFKRWGAPVALAALLMQFSPEGWNPGWERWNQRIQDAQRELALEASASPVEETSILYRAKTAANAWLLWQEHAIVGVGPGGFRAYAPSVADEGFSEPFSNLNAVLEYAHNDWLQMLVETGIIGALLWVIVAFTILRDLGRELRQDEPDPIGVTAFLALVAMGMNSTVSFGGYLAMPPIVAAALLAIFDRSLKHRPIAIPARVVIPGWLRIGGVAGLAVIVGASLFVQLRSNQYLGEIQAAFARRDYVEVIRQAREMEDGLRSEPDHLSYWARAALMRNAPEESRQASARFLQELPYDLSGQYLNALALEELGEEAAADAAIFRAAEQGASTLRLQLAAFSAAYKRGDFEMALRYLQRAWELEPTRERARALVSIAVQKNQILYAFQSLDQLQQWEGRSDFYWRQKALIFLNNGRTDKAKEALRASLELNPDQPEVRALLDRLEPAS